MAEANLKSLQIIWYSGKGKIIEAVERSVCARGEGGKGINSWSTENF